MIVFLIYVGYSGIVRGLNPGLIKTLPLINNCEENGYKHLDSLTLFTSNCSLGNIPYQVNQTLNLNIYMLDHFLMELLWYLCEFFAITPHGTILLCICKIQSSWSKTMLSCGLLHTLVNLHDKDHSHSTYFKLKEYIYIVIP